jgi:hypothetical protein
MTLACKSVNVSGEATKSLRGRKWLENSFKYLPYFNYLKPELQKIKYKFLIFACIYPKAI